MKDNNGTMTGNSRGVTFFAFGYRSPRIPILPLCIAALLVITLARAWAFLNEATLLLAATGTALTFCFWYLLDILTTSRIEVSRDRIVKRYYWGGTRELAAKGVRFEMYGDKAIFQHGAGFVRGMILGIFFDRSYVDRSDLRQLEETLAGLNIIERQAGAKCSPEGKEPLLVLSYVWWRKLIQVIASVFFTTIMGNVGATVLVQKGDWLSAAVFFFLALGGLVFMLEALLLQDVQISDCGISAKFILLGERTMQLEEIAVSESRGMLTLKVPKKHFFDLFRTLRLQRGLLQTDDYARFRQLLIDMNVIRRYQKKLDYV